jgi:hypothetical protein
VNLVIDHTLRLVAIGETTSPCEQVDCKSFLSCTNSSCVSGNIACDFMHIFPSLPGSWDFDDSFQRLAALVLFPTLTCMAEIQTNADPDTSGVSQTGKLRHGSCVGCKTLQ